MKYGRKGTAGGSWGRLPFPQSLLVVIVDKFLDVVELFVKVLEIGVRLLTLRIRLCPKELLSDLELHLLEIRRGMKSRQEQMMEKNAFYISGWLHSLAASNFQTSMFKAGRRRGCGNVILNECFGWEFAGNHVSAGYDSVFISSPQLTWV